MRRSWVTGSSAARSGAKCIAVMTMIPFFAIGCGDTPNTVIAPGAGYQLTAEEEANRQETERLRKGEERS